MLGFFNGLNAYWVIFCCKYLCLSLYFLVYAIEFLAHFYKIDIFNKFLFCQGVKLSVLHLVRYKILNLGEIC